MRERPAGEADRVDGGAQVAGDEREVGRLDRDVGAGADREPEVGLGERRRVVDAVADHRDDVSLGLQAPDLGRLLRPGRPRRATRSIPTSAATRSAASRPSPVRRTGVEPERPQLRDRLGARRLDGVAHLEGRARHAVPARPRSGRRCAPTDDVAALDAGRRTPTPGLAAEAVTGGSSPTSTRAARATACATGCSDAASTAPARRSTSARVGAVEQARPRRARASPR